MTCGAGNFAVKVVSASKLDSVLDLERQGKLFFMNQSCFGFQAGFKEASTTVVDL